MSYHWDFAVVLRSDGLFIQGAVATLSLTESALALAVPIGFVLVLLRMAPMRVVSWSARLFIDFFRTSALFVLIIWFFFAFPMLVHVRLDAFQAATLAIGLQAGAYCAEIFRAGIESIHTGQWQAAKALGLHTGATLRLVILPQAGRRILPVFLNLVVDTIKNTSFAAVISYSELTYEGMRVASNTYRPLEVFTIVGGFYFVIITAAARVSALAEKRLALRPP
jgi:polar amino acid transport system permease protein